MSNLVFAWKACRAVKSNAIVLAQASATVGIGMGQVNRVDSCRLAVERAGDRACHIAGTCRDRIVRHLLLRPAGDFLRRNTGK